MKRLRVLAALLGCLAVLASGFVSVAAATVLAGPSAQPQSTLGEQPCDHCDSCGTVPCAAPTSSCLQTSSNVSLTLATVPFDLPAMDAGKIRWSLRTASLTGLCPPPDPIPPRA